MSVSINNQSNMVNKYIDVQLAKKYSGRLFENYPLKKLNTWHVGGCADIFFQPETQNDLQNFIKDFYNYNHQNINYITWLGLGSNVLIRDGGVRGLVISTGSVNGKGLSNMAVTQDGLISCEAGVPCAKFSKFLVKNNYPDGSFWSGIPGTIGGALRMNAGCYGFQTWDFVDKLEIINNAGEIFLLNKEDFMVAYRKIKLNKKLEFIDNNLSNFGFIRASFKLNKDITIDGKDRIKKLLQQRSSSQPIGKLCCGSVFKNPENNFSAKLIEAAGLKGYKIGGALVSDKHANFIINDKTATAQDIEQLINYVSTQVYESCGIKLEPEVRIIGESIEQIK